MKKHTKQDYVNEVLRLCKTLTQLKYDSNDDRVIKKLIAENIEAIGRIEHEKALQKEIEGTRRKRAYGGKYGTD